MMDSKIHYRSLGGARYTACGYPLALLAFASITTEIDEITCETCKRSILPE